MKASVVQSGFESTQAIVARLAMHAARHDLNPTEIAARDFVQNQVQTLYRLNEEACYALWDTLTLGGEKVSKREDNEDDKTFEARLEELQTRYGEAEKRAQKVVIDYKFNPQNARGVVALYPNRNNIREMFLRRQIDLAYPEFAEYTVDPALYEQIENIKTDLGLMYGDFEAEYRGQKIKNQKLEQMLKETRGSSGRVEAEELVKAKLQLGNHKLHGTGPTYAEKILEAVRLRNLYARKAGYSNYYSYQLSRLEIDENELLRLMREVKIALKPMYDKLREKMDIACIKRYGISKEEARLPWFQCGVNEPGILEDVMSFSSDGYFKEIDPRPILKSTAKSIGTDADSIVDKSDLFPRPGKNPHWYLFDLETPTDIRSLGNIDPNFQDRMGYAFSTELHEIIGHGVGGSLVNPILPHMFRTLHTIVTEADAMMMEDLMYNEHWLREMLDFDKAAIDAFLTLGKQFNLAHNLVTFFHNHLLITDFEREMYNLPDSELTLDKVNKLWKDKTEEYLGIKIPKDRNEPDWTYKIHFATAPVYYQCYFLGQLLRAQVTAKINELSGQRGLFSTETGDFLRKYRDVGDAYTWSELTRHMTGKPLGIEALKAEFDELVLN